MKQMDPKQTIFSGAEPNSSLPRTPSVFSGGTNPAGDIILTPSTPPSPKRSKAPIVVAVVFVLCAIGAAMLIPKLFSDKQQIDSNTSDGSGSVSVSLAEAKKRLERFNYMYIDLAELYNHAVGADASFPSNADNVSLFPVAYSHISIMSDYLTRIHPAYSAVMEIDELSDASDSQKEEFKSLQSDSATTLTTMKKNLTTIQDFYTAFIQPIFEHYSDAATLEDHQTDEMKTLINSSDGKIAAAANHYYDIYHEAIQKLPYSNSMSVLAQNMEAQTLAEAKTLFSQTLDRLGEQESQVSERINEMIEDNDTTEDENE